MGWMVERVSIQMLPPVPVSIETKEKEEGELDSSIDESTASEKTTVYRHAAGGMQPICSSCLCFKDILECASKEHDQIIFFC